MDAEDYVRYIIGEMENILRTEHGFTSMHEYELLRGCERDINLDRDARKLIAEAKDGEVQWDDLKKWSEENEDLFDELRNMVDKAYEIE